MKEGLMARMVKIDIKFLNVSQYTWVFRIQLNTYHSNPSSYLMLLLKKCKKQAYNGFITIKLFHTKGHLLLSQFILLIKFELSLTGCYCYIIICFVNVIVTQQTANTSIV